MSEPKADNAVSTMSATTGNDVVNDAGNNTVGDRRVRCLTVPI